MKSQKCGTKTLSLTEQSILECTGETQQPTQPPAIPMQKMESVRTTEMLEQIKSIEDVGADIIKHEELEYNSQGIIDLPAQGTE